MCECENGGGGGGCNGDGTLLQVAIVVVVVLLLPPPPLPPPLLLLLVLCGLRGPWCPSGSTVPNLGGVEVLAACGQTGQQGEASGITGRIVDEFHSRSAGASIKC